jgi:hypothetical protein
MLIHQTLIKLTKIQNYFAVVIVTSFLAMYIGAQLYNTHELVESFIYIALLTMPFLIIPLLTIWAFKRSLNRMGLLTSLLANLLLLLLNLVASYLTNLEGEFHRINPQIYGDSENWWRVTFIVNAPIVLLTSNIIAIAILMFRTQSKIQSNGAVINPKN